MEIFSMIRLIAKKYSPFAYLSTNFLIFSRFPIFSRIVVLQKPQYKTVVKYSLATVFSFLSLKTIKRLGCNNSSLFNLKYLVLM